MASALWHSSALASWPRDPTHSRTLHGIVVASWRLRSMASGVVRAMLTCRSKAVGRHLVLVVIPKYDKSLLTTVFSYQRLH